MNQLLNTSRETKMSLDLRHSQHSFLEVVLMGSDGAPHSPTKVCALVVRTMGVSWRHAGENVLDEPRRNIRLVRLCLE